MDRGRQGRDRKEGMRKKAFSCDTLAGQWISASLMVLFEKAYLVTGCLI